MTDSYKELERALRDGNVAKATALFERLTKRGLPRGAFPFDCGENIVLTTEETLFIGTVLEVDVSARWVRLFPVIIISTTRTSHNDPSVYTDNSFAEMLNEGLDALTYSIHATLDVPYTAALNTYWEAAPYIHTFPPKVPSRGPED